MKIATTYEAGNIFQHFGHSRQFKIYEIADGVIKSGAVFSTNGNGHGALAGFLKRENVDTLICGGIGGGAKNALVSAGIKLYSGPLGIILEGEYFVITSGSLSSLLRRFNSLTYSSAHSLGSLSPSFSLSSL